MRDKLASCSVEKAFVGLLKNKKVYIIYDTYTEKTYISHNMVFFEREWVGPSQVYISVLNNNESDESDNKIDATISSGSKLTY